MTRLVDDIAARLAHKSGRDDRLGTSSRSIVCCLSTDEPTPRLMAVILDVEGKFYICRTRGEEAMRDIGPYDSVDTAVSIAKLIIPHDVVENSDYTDKFGFLKDVATVEAAIKALLNFEEMAEIIALQLTN